MTTIPERSRARHILISIVLALAAVALSVATVLWAQNSGKDAIAGTTVVTTVVVGPQHTQTCGKACTEQVAPVRYTAAGREHDATVVVPRSAQVGTEVTTRVDSESGAPYKTPAKAIVFVLVILLAGVLLLSAWFTWPGRERVRTANAAGDRSLSVAEIGRRVASGT